MQWITFVCEASCCSKYNTCIPTRLTKEPQNCKCQGRCFSNQLNDLLESAASCTQELERISQKVDVRLRLARRTPIFYQLKNPSTLSQYIEKSSIQINSHEYCFFLDEWFYPQKTPMSISNICINLNWRNMKILEIVVYLSHARTEILEKTTKRRCSWLGYLSIVNS